MLQRSKHSLSHYKLCTMDMGYLVPLTWYEALPGDTIQQATSALIRVSPLLSPVMHPVRVRIHHWFVPLRLIWEDFEDFITGGPDGTSVPEHPYKSLTTISEGGIDDYLGIPPGNYSPNIKYSALPLRAYTKIYNEHYRDQDLINEANCFTNSGQDTDTPRILYKAAWEKDYFTTSRPWETKGDTVTIPMADTADIISAGDGKPTFDDVTNTAIKLQTTAGSADAYFSQTAGGSGSEVTWNDPKLAADLSTATGIAINDLRLALAIQRYQEARAQYGSRYVEYLRYLGVRSSDGRLSRPEYLGGGRQVIQFSEVLSTDGANTGSMKGHGISAMRTNRYRRFFEEHGIVMTLMSVIPKSIYTEGVHRAFSRETKEDYFQRELQYIGEQEVYNREIQAGHTSPDGIFGYQARYDEYRSIPSGIAGEFRSTLNHWHYAREFSGDVALNQSFIDATPTKRVNASTGTDCLYVMANHSIQARRQLAQKAKNKTF